MNKQIEAVADAISPYIDYAVDIDDVAKAAIKAYQESAWIDISEYKPEYGEVLVRGFDDEGEYFYTANYSKTFEQLMHKELTTVGIDYLTHFQHIQKPKPKGETE